MTPLDTVRAIYDSFLEQAIALEQNRGLGDGLLGFGKKPSDDPCYSGFIESLGEALSDLAQTAPASGEVRAVLSFIYEAQLAHRDPPSIYWMLLAAHGQTLDLVPLLSPQDAAGLFSLYRKAVPRQERLPVQKRLYAALKRQAAQ